MTRPLVIAHRGSSGERPENTLSAFERAVVAHPAGHEPLDRIPREHGHTFIEKLRRRSGRKVLPRVHPKIEFRLQYSHSSNSLFNLPFHYHLNAVHVFPGFIPQLLKVV